MRITQGKLAVPVAAVIALVAALWVAHTSKNPMRLHLDRLHDLETSWAGPSTFVDYLRPHTWRWFLRGRPPAADTFKEVDEHWQALIKLGYFETHVFALERRRVDDSSFFWEIRSLATNSIGIRSRWRCGSVGPYGIAITARPEDMPVWSNIVRRFDQAVPRASE